jgi:hypothetical protein
VISHSTQEFGLLDGSSTVVQALTRINSSTGRQQAGTSHEDETRSEVLTRREVQVVGTTTNLSHVFHFVPVPPAAAYNGL